MNPRARAFSTAGLAAALLGAVFLYVESGSERAPAANPQPALSLAEVARQPSLRRTSAPPIAARREPAIARPLPLPDSLRGTEADGELRADARGHLILNPAVRRFFEYHLTAEGEESSAAINARMLARARAVLPEQATGEFQTLLQRYLSYRQAGRALSPAGGLEEKLLQVSRLRREQLGDEAATALFADSDALDNFAVKRAALENDGTLSESERRSREAALEADLPPQAQQARLEATAPARLDAEEAAMRQAGATDDELFAARAQTSGPAAAQRLAELDQKRVEWQQRLRDFNQRRAALPADQPEAAQRLLAEMFSEPEQVRVLALDRSGQP